MSANPDDRIAATRDTQQLEIDLNLLRGYATVLCTVSLERMDALLTELEREETLMPFFDPTAYRNLADSMHEHKVMVRALRDCRAKLETLRAKVNR